MPSSGLSPIRPSAAPVPTAIDAGDPVATIPSAPNCTPIEKAMTKSIAAKIRFMVTPALTTIILFQMAVRLKLLSSDELAAAPDHPDRAFERTPQRKPANGILRFTDPWSTSA